MRMRLLLAGLLALAAFAAAAAEAPLVLIKTEKGDITVEVDHARAPVTAARASPRSARSSPEWTSSRPSTSCRPKGKPSSRRSRSYPSAESKDKHDQGE